MIRVSGPRAPAIAAALLGVVPQPRHATHAAFRDADGHTLDDGLALFFPDDKSFTGEPVLELHGHGGPVVLDRVLAQVLALGARAGRARPRARGSPGHDGAQQDRPHRRGARRGR